MIDTQTAIRELTEPHIHREHFHREKEYADGSTTRYPEDHVTTQPSLLDQLEAAIHHTNTADDVGGAGTGSRPAARLDAIDTLHRISAQAYDWTPRPTLTDTVRAAHAYIAGQPPCQKWDPDQGCCKRHVGDQQIRRWWIWARLATGWDREPFRPDATCPACGKRGGLRVNVDDEHKHATCADCHTTWDDRTIDRLGFHIQAENECAEAGCDHRASHTIRVCDTTYRYLTQAETSRTLAAMGEVSLAEGDLLAGLTG